MKALQAFQNALLARRVLARAASNSVGTEFSSPEALQEYMKEHPNADPKNHSVRDTEKSSPKEEGSGSPSDSKSLNPKVQVAAKHAQAGINGVKKLRKDLKTLDLKPVSVATKLEDQESYSPGGAKIIRQKGADHEKGHVVNYSAKSDPISNAEAAVDAVDKKRINIHQNLNKEGVQLPEELLGMSKALRESKPTLVTQKGYINENPYASRPEMRESTYVKTDDLDKFKESYSKYLDSAEKFFAAVDKHLKS